LCVLVHGITSSSETGHFPMLDDADRIADELARFVESSEPYHWDIDSMREGLRAGPPT
jgi:hypothetical protein